MEVTKHELVAPKFVCPLCNKIPKWYSHLNDECSGDALECKSCHNYILYISTGTKEEDIERWKDEIYIPSKSGDILVMRGFEDNTTFISINDKKVITLNQIIQFKSLDDLINKVRTIVVFS